MGGGDDQLQPGEEDGGAPIEVVARADGLDTQEEDLILIDINSMWEEKLPCEEISVDDPVPEGGKPQGAGYPVTTPHSRDPLAGVGGDEQIIETGGKLDGKTSKKRESSTNWWESLVGLVGWWRRVELEQSKLESRTRKLEGKVKKTEEERKRNKENKITFLRKFYPNISKTPGGSERLRPGENSSSILKNPDNNKHRSRELPLSPFTKRKAEGGEHFGRFSSPTKKLKFSEKVRFWKEQSGSSDLEEPYSGLVDYLGGTKDLAEDGDSL